MNLFYCPHIADGLLPEEDSRHAVKVLRMQAGDECVLLDGVGGYHRARITLPHPSRCAFEIVETIKDYGKRNYRLHIAIAPTKNIERFEWFLEKATEIGVDEITPLLCRHSERKIIKPERLEKVIIAAAKQSVKAFFPVLNPLTDFNQLLKQQLPEARFIAHCHEGEKIYFPTIAAVQKDVLVLIGPEGDFSTEEVTAAMAAGFKAVSLGESRLRTETAGVVSCAAVSVINHLAE